MNTIVESEYIHPVKYWLSEYKEKDVTEDLKIAQSLFKLRSIHALDTLQVMASHESPVELQSLFSMKDDDICCGSSIQPMNTRESFWNEFLNDPCFVGKRVINGIERDVVIASHGMGGYTLIFSK
jgi:hypothetical protein